MGVEAGASSNCQDFRFLDHIEGEDYNTEICQGFNFNKGQYKLTYYDHNGKKTGFDVLSKYQYKDYRRQLEMTQKLIKF